jgi:predicted nucleotidyltransferase component of viral defense system
MKPYLSRLVKSADSNLQGKNLVREYLQAYILRILQTSGAMIPLAFHGGTALRFLHAIPRYSEDLDFALERSVDDYDFRSYLLSIQREFEKMNYQVNIKFKDNKTVHNALIRFPGLLYNLELSSHQEEVLAVKLEIDTNPPAGAGLETTVVRRHVILQLQHHDPASLFAGKLHALLQREYVKGRDIYDLLWYLSDSTWVEPNLLMLNAALAQTGWSGEQLTQKTWRVVVRERIENLSWERVLSDVSPFIEHPSELINLIHENLLQLLENK